MSDLEMARQWLLYAIQDLDNGKLERAHHAASLAIARIESDHREKMRQVAARAMAGVVREFTAALR